MAAAGNKAALKALRQERKERIERARKRIKSSTRQIQAIKTELKGGERTVPELAAALKMSSAEVLILVSALRKYGEVLEGAKAGDYFRYRLAASEG